MVFLLSQPITIRIPIEFLEIPFGNTRIVAASALPVNFEGDPVAQ
jgi:hypothetical protein